MVKSKKNSFMNDEERLEIINILKTMTKNDSYNTESSYSSNNDIYPDNQIPFVDKHMNYLDSHPDMNPKQYISNLRLMIHIG